MVEKMSAIVAKFLQENYHKKEGFDHTDLLGLKDQLKEAKKKALKVNDLEKLQEIVYLTGVIETLDGIPQNYYDKKGGPVPESCMKYVLDVGKNAKEELVAAMQRLGWNPQTYL